MISSCRDFRRPRPFPRPPRVALLPLPRFVDVDALPVLGCISPALASVLRLLAGRPHGPFSVRSVLTLGGAETLALSEGFELFDPRVDKDDSDENDNVRSTCGRSGADRDCSVCCGLRRGEDDGALDKDDKEAAAGL